MAAWNGRDGGPGDLGKDRSVELYQLKTFVMVAAEGHLTRASERLHTSQPAVSAHIKSLEEEMGVPLFIRTPKGMVLTREGEILRDKARSALETIEDLCREASRMKEKVVGTARIGLHIDPQFLKIDCFLSHMRRHHPELDFHLLQRWSWQQPEAFKQGALDGGFVYGRPDLPDLEVIALREFNVVVVGPIEWADKLSGAGWKEIARLPWIWTPPNCRFCDIAMQAFQSRGLQPLRVTVADQEPLISTLVAAGIGLAIMIEEEAIAAREQGRIAIWEEVLDRIELSFIHARKRANEPMIKAVTDGIRQVWKLPPGSADPAAPQ
jgi:DNA-binding transcriptional LysR family regulator